MIEPIVPAVLQAQRDPGELVDNAVRRNVSRTVERLRTASEPLLLDPLRAGRLKIVGARTIWTTGAWISSTPPPLPQAGAPEPGARRARAAGAGSPSGP